MDAPFHSTRLAVLYLMPQGWRYFESRTSGLDELEAAFWAPAPAKGGSLQHNLDPSEARVICDQQASRRLLSVMSSGAIVSVVLAGSEDDRARLARLLPERVRAKVTARLDPPHPWLSREELTGLVSRAIQSLPQPVAKG